MNKRKKIQFTKIIVTITLVIALIDLQLTYILAFMGCPETLEETSGKIITEIIGVILVYCAKSFFETREEKKNEIMRGNDEDENIC